MPRQKKDSVKVSYTLERRIVDEMELFCEKTGRTKTKVIEIALEEYLKRHKDEK